MSTERYMLIRCNSCGVTVDPVDTAEMSEAELRRDLRRRCGWLSFRTDTPRGHQDICPNCQATAVSTMKGGR